jgi:GNAT superfamily N-acetyltransferase
MLEELSGIRGYKFAKEDSGKEVGRVFLYLINNDLHEKPYGLMEDLFVLENYRGKGIASDLISELIEKAKELNCYKIVGQSRFEREEIHIMYEKRGFTKHGFNFRLDL